LNPDARGNGGGAAAAAQAASPAVFDPKLVTKGKKVPTYGFIFFFLVFFP
jgi:hypothetical protein